MGNFLTSHSRLEQLDIPGKWITLDNQLYKDKSGQLFLCPRNTITDGYTIPEILSFIAGGRMQWDTRASSQHDFECYYHKYIKVLLNEYELRKMRILHMLDSKIVCEDIPIEYLIIQDTDFTETNDRFFKMLQTFQSVPAWRKKLLRLGVCFNAKWFFKTYHFDKYKIYKVDYELLK